MTKPRRIVLLVVDIITLFAGIVAVALAIALSLYPGWPKIPSRDEILAASPTSLRSKMQSARENMETLVSMKQEARDRFMFIGGIVVVGTILRLSFTPWRVRERTDRAAS